MGKNYELNEFEYKQVIGLWKARRTHKTISHILKIPKTAITDTITQHGGSDNGLNAKRTGR